MMVLKQNLRTWSNIPGANAVEIRGVLEQKNENIVIMVMEVRKVLDMEITANMIDACHQMGCRTGPNYVPPGIIVD